MNELPQDFLAVLRLPVRQEADLDAQQTFFGQPEFQAFHADVGQGWDSDDVLRASAALLPGLHPHRAALLTLFCGALVEDGADPHLMFDAALQLMGRVLASLAPYCATEPMEVEEGDEGEKGGRQDEEELAAWQAANAALEALAPPARFEVDALRAAVDLLVPPLMAMAMRDVRNHRALLADRELLAHLDAMYANDSLPFEDLHYLHGAASLSYEDELVVLLPTSRSGMIVRAHAVNNNFHAFSLLQDLMETHAQQLGIRQPPRTRGDDEGSDTAAFCGCRHRPSPTANSSMPWPGAGVKARCETTLVGRGDRCSSPWKRPRSRGAAGTVSTMGCTPSRTRTCRSCASSQPTRSPPTSPEARRRAPGTEDKKAKSPPKRALANGVRAPYMPT